jgi:HemY protein
VRRLLIILVLLVASTWVAVTIMHHPGYMLIITPPWMVQLPLSAALLSTFLFLVLFYFIIDGIDRLEFLWFRIKNWWRYRRANRSHNQTQLGLTLLIEGRFRQAERLLVKGMHASTEPLMNLLGAAKAADRLGKTKQRDDYFKRAATVAPQAKLAIGLTRAELLYTNEQFEEAVGILRTLKSHAPRHPEVLKWLEKVYVRLADWPHLLLLLPDMRKAKLLDKTQGLQFEKNLYCEMWRDAAARQTLVEVKRIWAHAPHHVKHDSEAVCAYVKALMHFNEKQDVDSLIAKALKHQWQGELVSLYGLLSFTNLNRQLAIVGDWLKRYGPQPETFLTLGRLCVQLQLWGKAKDYFEKCLSFGPNPDASLAYGALLEQLGEREAALAQYREALRGEVI